MEIVREQSIKEFINNNPATSFIIITITIVQGLTYILGNGPTDYETARRFGAMLSINKNMTELPYLLTSTYQHIGGMMHYLFNLSAVIVSAPFLERVFGTVRFTLLYNLCGIAGSATTLYFTQNVISSGASGAIFGLTGVYVALLVKQHHWLTSDIKQRIIPILIYGLIFTFVVPNISITGHLGGLLAGMILGMIISPKPDLIRTQSISKSIMQTVAITLACWFVLISPQIIKADFSNLVLSRNSFNLFNVSNDNTNFFVNNINPLYDELNNLSDLYNNEAISKYNIMVDVTNSFGNRLLSTENLEILNSDKVNIEKVIANLETHPPLQETAIVHQNLQEIFYEFLYLNKLIASEYNNGDGHLYGEIEQQFSKVNTLMATFSANMETIYNQEGY